MRKNTQMTWWRISRRVRGHARTVRGVPQSKSPRGGSFLKKEQERERCGEGLLRFGKEKEGLLLSPRDLGPTCAWHARTVRDSPADGPAPRRGRSVISSRTSSTAPSAIDPRGRSAPHQRTVCQVPRTVRPTTADSPTSLFHFSLIYFEIKI
jgi:hypothetical protein